jgi:hypothetical protein
MSVVWGPGVPFTSVGRVFARPFPLAEVVFADASVLFVDVGGRFEEAMEGEGDGGGGGLAYSSVHCRAIESCMERLRRNSVAIDGTGDVSNINVSAQRRRWNAFIPNGSAEG